MEFNYKYLGSSSVNNSASKTDVSFAPDTLRSPTFFVGQLNKHIAFREAISALHDVVVSDLRFQPKDRTEYLEWAKQNEIEMLGEFISKGAGIEGEMKNIRQELNGLRDASAKLMTPYYKAQRKYFNYLYRTDYNAWFVLDPIITIHPDEIFFECFSQDESSYGKLSCNYNVFKNINEFACGTTNIDYSAELYNEFQKVRDYKDTQFQIDPSGFDVQTGNDEEFREEKIDLPDSWVRGLLQVSSAMTLPLISVDLHPMDIHNFCFLLRRFKEKHGPRSIRFELTPDKPVTAIFEPWNKKIVCSRSIYKGNEQHEIRIWGRRRLLILERLIPITKKFTISLLGSGLPSFFQADLGDMTFTLGLSGWTANDWSRMGNFDLMAPRADVDNDTKKRVFDALKETWKESADSLAQRLNLDRSLVLAALSIYTQAGRVIYDLKNDLYRLRELSRDPLPMDQLRFSNEREERANNFVKAKLAKINQVEPKEKIIQVTGTVMDDGRKQSCTLRIDNDERLVGAECSCHFYVHNKMHKGPCEHMIALRMQFSNERNN